MRLEAIDRLDPAEVRTLEEVVDGLLLKHEARRFVRSA
jgi:hypothetical protein